MINVLVWAVFGLLVGAVARYLHPGEEPPGALPTILSGLSGSFIGGAINYYVHGSLDFKPAGFLMSVIGAVVSLAVYRWVCSKNVE